MPRRLKRKYRIVFAVKNREHFKSLGYSPSALRRYKFSVKAFSDEQAKCLANLKAPQALMLGNITSTAVRADYYLEQVVEVVERSVPI